MRILSLDVGDKRIGLAVSDPLGITAQGLPTLERKGLSADMAYILDWVKAYQTDRVIIGLPRNMNGTLGPQGEKVQAFGESLKAQGPLDIVYWDERLTTVSAHRAMLEGDVRRKKRREQADKIAAVLILQNYLDYISR